VALVVFFSATFAMSWSAWTLATRIDASLRGTIVLLGTIAPSLVAIALTARGEGRAGVAALLARILRFDVHPWWYLFAAGSFAVLKLAAAALHRAVSGAWPRFGDEPVVLMFAALIVSTWVQAGEEIGWRGYALPRLAGYIGLPGASVLLGIIWAAWHLPHFAMPWSDLAGQSFVVYLLQVTAISIAMAWLYWKTKGSLLLVMLLHAAVNNTKDIVPSAASEAAPAVWLGGSLVAWLTIGLLWVAALFFLSQMRDVDRSQAARLQCV
jgi:membrane protease YdiL (CAAX protease family)